MPIPILIWAGVAAAGSVIAWKNRKAIGKGLEAMGNALASRATREVDELLGMPIPAAERHVDATVPDMDAVYWPFFQQELGKRAIEDSAAYTLLRRANEVRDRNHERE